MKNHLKYFIALLIISTSAFADVKIRNISQDNDTISLGMAKFPNYIETTFEITNNDAISYKLEKINPSLIISAPSNITSVDFEEFSIQNASPIIISPKSTQRIIIRYTPNADYTKYPPGHKTALLKIGLFPSNLISVPSKKEEMTYYKEFLLRIKKTTQDLNFLENVAQIDSIYINPVTPIDYIVKLQSNTPSKLKILQEEVFYTSNNVVDGEFARTDLDDSPDFNNIYDYKFRRFTYSPLNRGWDTVDYRVIYQNIDTQSPDTTIFKFIAFAAEQQIRLFDAIDARVSNDTIYLNDTRIGNFHSFKVIIKNLGNLPYGINAQSILKENTNQNEEAFIFDKFFLPSGKHLQIASTDTAEIKFTPSERKTYIGRVVIRSDINVRDISNINNSARETLYYIAARGVAPDIELSSAVIDFPTLNISDECPQIFDTTISVYNPGNQLLRINSIEFSPKTTNPFEINASDVEIPPGKKLIFDIRLNTDGLPIGKELNYQLKFKNNSLDKQEIAVNLRVKTAALTDIKVEFPKTTKSKTGRIIEIPILSEKSKISRASNFNCSISYNKDILEYAGYTTTGTASEPAINAIVIDEGANELTINCNSKSGNFLPNDTLFKIKFRTYLADTYISPLTFNRFTLGNALCPNLYSINYYNRAEFQIDSLGGIDFKVLKPNNTIISIKSIFPNPASDNISINLFSTEDGKLDIEILDNIGKAIHKIQDLGFSEGSNSIKIDLPPLNIGTYYLKISSINNMNSVIKPIKFSIMR